MKIFRRVQAAHLDLCLATDTISLSGQMAGFSRKPKPKNFRYSSAMRHRRDVGIQKFNRWIGLQTHPIRDPQHQIAVILGAAPVNIIHSTRGPSLAKSKVSSLKPFQRALAKACSLSIVHLNPIS